jgi:hypothetical protein
VTDLAPLRGLPLETLRFSRTEVADLEPLRGMALHSIQFWTTNAGVGQPTNRTPRWRR